jgi:ubiquinone/menaquinone biosynthesis C-methylase UbiE
MRDKANEGQFAGLYDLAFNPVLRRVHYTILRLAKKYDCQSIIDIGCGTGAQAKVLANQGFSVTGVDSSEKMINAARKNTSNSTSFILQDITSIDFKENVFDAANICLVLHPNTKEKMDEIIWKSKTLIKQNGVVFITDYGKGTGFSGRIANGLIRIIESFAQPNHRKNYYSFMKHGGIDLFYSFSDIKIIEKHHYFNGALQTIIIKFQH